MVNTVSSPNGKIKASLSVNKQGKIFYTVHFGGKEIIKPSEMGLVRNDSSFAKKMSIVKVSEPQIVKDNYDMLLGKKRYCKYEAVRRVFTLKNPENKTIDIILQVSNDGVAFRYAFGEVSQDIFSIEQEKTSFAFKKDTVSWLHPIQPAKTGWEQTQPSYE